LAGLDRSYTIRGEDPGDYCLGDHIPDFLRLRSDNEGPFDFDPFERVLALLVDNEIEPIDFARALAVVRHEEAPRRSAWLREHIGVCICLMRSEVVKALELLP
jgi:hypothetical protein